MNWFDWILVGSLAVLFVLALRHIIRQVKKGRCCGCSGCGGCEGCPSCSGCEEGLGRLEHEEDADSGRSAGQSAAGCRSDEAAEQKHPEKRAAEVIPDVRKTGRFLTGLRVQAVQMVSPKATEGSQRPPAREQLPAAPVRKNADAGGRFRWKMREGLGGSDHD